MGKKVELENGSVLILTGKEENEYTEVEITISKIVADSLVVGVGALNVNESLIQLGADSLETIEIVQEIENVYHIEITPEEMTKSLSIFSIANLIEKKSKKAKNQ